MQNSNLNFICQRSFPGINSLQIALVEDTEPKNEWADKYFLFIKAVPGVQSTANASGRTYDHTRAVTFKASPEKALSFAFALKVMSEGRGKQYDDLFGGFTMFADTSKSQYSQGGGSRKSMMMNYYQNNKTNKQVISVGFKQDSNVVSLFMTPYDAYATGQVLEKMAHRALDLAITGSNLKVNTGKPAFNGNKTNQSQPAQLPAFQQPVVDNTQSIDQVADNFSAMFSDDNPFG